MTAELARHPASCGGCGTTVPVNAALYRVCQGKQIRCEDCARKMIVGPLPVPEPYQPPPPKRLELPRFERMTMGRTLRRNILDWRARQAGEA